MEASNVAAQGLSASDEYLGPDCVEIPGLVVSYLKVAERIAALLPTPSFLEDLDRRRRNVARFVWTLDAAPRDALKAELIAAELDVSGWWDAVEPAPQAQQAIGG